MINVYLLKDYQESNKGDIIRVRNGVAQELIDGGTARIATNRDFLIKPEFGVGRAFNRPPSKGGVIRDR